MLQLRYSLWPQCGESVSVEHYEYRCLFRGHLAPVSLFWCRGCGTKAQNAMSEGRGGENGGAGFFSKQRQTALIPAAPRGASPLLGKDFECIQRIFAASAGERMKKAFTFSHASHHAVAVAVAAKHLHVMEGTAFTMSCCGRPLRYMFCFKHCARVKKINQIQAGAKRKVDELR